ncbi:MAG: translation initiation factor IF-2 [Desulfobacteraceae bacterium]|nr:translation initiation factor IF-2 [Desulfobacteraceae bacterium]
MAKIRVYELARELNMKNKALLEKLSEMHIAVRSHMSSLDDDVVDRIKANLLGKDAVEEKRVKPTVIRRRSKKPVHPEPENEIPVSAEQEMKPEKSAEPDSDKHRNDAGLLSETVGKTSEEPDRSHGIISEPVPEKEPEKQEQNRIAKQQNRVAEQKNETKKVSEQGAPEKRVPNKTGAVTGPRTATGKDTQNKMQAPEKVKKTESGGQKRQANFKPGQKSEKPSESRPSKSRRKKRAKKEMPAKIIQLPSAQEEKPPAPVKSRPEKPAPAKAAVKNKEMPGRKENNQKPAEEKKASEKDLALASDKKKKKWKKDTEEPSKEKKGGKEIKWAKKKISFKRKEVVEGDELYGDRGRKSRKGGAKGKAAPVQKPHITTPKAIKRRIKIDDTIVLSDLAKRMGIKASEMIAKLMNMGVMVTVNQTIDFDTAVLVASEFDYELERASFKEDVVLKTEKEDNPEKMIQRPPVVTIMGHVDHGKTSLLDVIRKTKVTEHEAGGITQHIGAYNVTTGKGQVAFLDTPGHEAFTSMRARGALVTDIVVLVVAADDGVMPQTIEAINHSKAAGVPIIVAVNKIDKANAEPDRVVRQLSDHGLVPEDWGGDTIFVQVSAKQSLGIDELLEMILLQSEVLELKANPEKLAIGYVVEAKLDSGRGAVATVLVQEGTLKLGDSVVCGIHHGKIRAMINDIGLNADTAGPSTPVEVLGLSGVPNAGDELIALDDEKSAKQVSIHRVQKQRSKDLAKTSRLSLEKLFEKMKQGEVKDLNLIIRADVHGSIEALRDSLVKLSNEEVSINVIHSATGTITETDVSLAAVSDAIIIGFNVRPTPKVQALANDENVDMRFYNIIYDVIKEVKDAIVGMMSSTYKEHVMGRADVREVFVVPKVGAIAGCYITDGKIQRGQFARLLRDGVVTFDGKIGSLRRFKDDVKEVQTGYECGIGIENYNDIKIGDVIECYHLEEIKPEL